MEFALILILLTWKCNAELTEQRHKAEREARAYERIERESRQVFIKSLEGLSPEAQQEAWKAHGRAMSAAITCASVACF